MIKLTTLLFCAAPLLCSAQPSVNPLSEQVLSPQLLELGDCLNGHKVVDLTTVLFISNRVLREKPDAGFDQVTLMDQTLVFQAHLSSQGRFDYETPYDLAFFVGDAKGDADLDLSFVELEDGRKAVFWRETYKHRSHRQGIVTWDGPKLVKLCEGTGGVDSQV